MSSILVNGSVSATAIVANYTKSATHVKNETIDDAISLGTLSEEGVIVKISDQGQQANSAVSTTFTVDAGDNLSLSLSFNNIVDKATTRFQLYDPDGTIVADNQGTAAQQAAYETWASGSYTAASAGTYTAIATPSNGSAASISSQVTQGTSLQVNSKLTGAHTKEYYTFSLADGDNIKMALDAGTKESSIRVQLLNSSGNIVADSQGNAYQRAAYEQLTSGSGLTAETGDYTVMVGYSDKADTTKDISYNFQLYSGTTYTAVYKTTAKSLTYDPSAAGSMTPADQVEDFAAIRYNKIDASPTKNVNIGWLKEDTSALRLTSQLTGLNNTNYYNFTLQEGSAIKLSIDSTTTSDSSKVRIQLYDASGYKLLADSQGSDEMKKAYEELTSGTGLAVKDQSQYLVKVTYAEGASHTDTGYGFYLYSGDTYSALYETTASAQTFVNASLAGNLKNSMGKTGGSYLSSMLNGSLDWTQSLLDALNSRYK